MRFSLSVASVLAAAGLVSATPLEARRGELAILQPVNNARIGTPFAFQYIDNLRTSGDTSHLQLGFWNLTYRGDLGTLQFDKTNYTTATASVSVPALFENDGYALVVQQIDSGGNVLYTGDVDVVFTR
ncbi:hypothetical protein V8D89_013096 [Ganoderma adspersum]